MAYERPIYRYRSWYSKLLRLHPQPFYVRFGDGMEQTFHDLLRERVESGRGLLAFALWVFTDTLAGIIRENFISIMQTQRTLKFIFGALCILIVPLVAEILQNTQTLALEGFDWKLGDFAVVAVLLAAFGAALSYATGQRTLKQRVIGAALVLLVLATYVHLAVGIVDTWPLAGS